MLRAILFAITCFAATLGTARAEDRTALVIGNGAYSYAPLANAANDARDMADALRGAGFSVDLRLNADRTSMDNAIASFGEKLKKGGVGLFYFAGHGLQIDGKDYLLPVGGAPTSEDDARTMAVSVRPVIAGMAGSALDIVILDSCENNLLAAISRGAPPGLARIDGGAGLFVSFAASPGQVAEDGDGRNSPYAKHLIAAIRTPGLTIADAFRETLKDVYQETRGKQLPWVSSSFFGDFAFIPKAAAGPAASPNARQSGSEPPRADSARANDQAPAQSVSLAAGTGAPAPAGIYRVVGTNPNQTHYAGMVAITPAGDEFRINWWIANQVFSGSGRFAGRMLVVNWGDKSPVIYTFPSPGRLDGEWADGTASETLKLFAKATDAAAPPLGGRYAVRGRNPDGSAYQGSVTIAPSQGVYAVDWKVGSSAYHGTGVLAGSIFTVDWGSETPVVYALASDGSLSGLWNGGKGEETLTPVR